MATKFNESIKRLRNLNASNNLTTDKEIACMNLPNEEAMIIPISDLHFGSKQCNIKHFKETLKIILETPNCYTIFLGDLVECATKESVGLSIYDEEFPLDEQIVELGKLILPLVKAGKVLGIITGNHEMRLSYFAHLNPAELIAKQLEVPYYGYSGYISLKVGEMLYSIAIHHGVSGGSSVASKLTSMRKQSGVVEADLYLSGHTHGYGSDSDIIYRIDNVTRTVTPRKRHYAVCGSFLKYWDGYAEMKNLTPAQTGALAITFNNEQKEIIINE